MKKGDIVFVKKLRSRENEIIKAKVITYGSKYFTLLDLNNPYSFRNKFSLETMKDVSKFGPEYKVYLTEKEIQDEIDRPKYISQIADRLKIMSADELKNLINKNF